MQPATSMRSDKAGAIELVMEGSALHVNGGPLAHVRVQVGDDGPDQTVERTDEAGRFEYRTGDRVRTLEEGWVLVASRQTPTLTEFVFAAFRYPKLKRTSMAEEKLDVGPVGEASRNHAWKYQVS